MRRFAKTSLILLALTLTISCQAWRSNALTRLPDMRVRRRNAALIRLKDGRILILGGDTNY